MLGDYGKTSGIDATDSNSDGVINVSDLLTLLANYGATCDATGANAGRDINNCVPKTINNIGIVCCWDRHIERGGDTDEAWSTRLYQAMVCDPEATGGGAIASTLTGVDTITKDLADDLCKTVCSVGGATPLCTCDDTVRCEQPEDIDSIIASGAGTDAWNGVYRKDVSDLHPADGFVWILALENRELYKKKVGQGDARWRFASFQRGGPETVSASHPNGRHAEVEMYIARRDGPNGCPPKDPGDWGQMVILSRFACCPSR